MNKQKNRGPNQIIDSLRGDKSLARAVLLLKAFEGFCQQTVRGAQDFLKSFSASGLKDSFRRYQDQNLSQAEKVLLAFVNGKLHHFDLFHKVGFVANEDRLSDAVVALLDPNESHGLGTIPLKFLLEEIRGRAPQKVAAILPFVGEPAHIKVREREGRAIPDIQIMSNNFTIFIENKIQGGKEIEYPGESQTTRYWKKLQRKGKPFGIPDERLLAIFLNPEWKGLRTRISFLFRSTSSVPPSPKP